MSDIPNNHRLFCGAGKADITLPPGTPMGGYANRLFSCKGMLDPLHARALLLRSGDLSLLILTLDALAINTGRARMLATAASHACSGLVQPSGVHVVCSHTHSGADLAGLFGDAVSINRYFEQVRTAAYDATQQAYATFAPAQASWGETAYPLGRNRRLRPGHAQVSAVERRQGESIDHTLTVLHFERIPGPGTGAGQSLATLFHTACHPVCLGPENVLASGDFAGIAAQVLEAQTGAPALFFNGACGNVTPLIGRGSSYTATHELGESVARAVIEVDRRGAGNQTQLSVSSPSLVELPLGCHFKTPADIVQAAAWLLQQDTGFTDWPAVVHAWQQRMLAKLAASIMPRAIHIPLTAIRFSRIDLRPQDELTFVLIGAEVFNEYQLWQPPGVRLVGYADGEGCYIPTAAALEGGGYEVNTAPVYYGLPCAPGADAERALLSAIGATIQFPQGSL